MKIKKIFGDTQKDVISKRCNVFIGISIGNKWFTKDNLRKYLRWALDNSRSRVLFLITDKIHAINYGVRNKGSKERNLKIALRNGDKIEKMLKELIYELPKKEQGKIDVLRWEEYEKVDEFYDKFFPIVNEEFKSNSKFREDILNLVKSTIIDRTFSEEDYLKFSEYILREFIIIYSGIYYNSTYYGTYIYSAEFELSYFIEKMHKKEIFLELGSKLPKEKVVEVILNENE